MIQLSEEEFIHCFECDTEFTVSTESDDVSVSFCPYCGSEIELEEDEDEYDEDEDEEEEY